MEQTNLRMWPILYFQADWPAETPPFDFDVRLIKASEEILEIVRNVESPAWGCNNKAMCDFGGNTEWFLSLPSPEPTEHVSSSKIGMSFEGQLQEAVVKSFLMCLQLIRQTNAICPLEIENVEIAGASIDPDSFRNSLDKADFFGINTDSPNVFMPESFQLGDLQLLSDLWSSVIRLRNLDDWSKLVYREEFFAACDKEAGEGAVKKIVDVIMSSPAYLEFSKEEKKQHRKQLNASFKEELRKGDQFLSELYKDNIKEVFLKKQEEVFSNRTRIGRALNLFYEGLGLPLLHSFLSMCLVLETLFTIGEGEILHKLAVRVAKVVGREQNLEQRRDIYERTKGVYAQRSQIVHGEKLIDVVDHRLLKDAFILARQSLQSILLNEVFLKLYSNPGTTDKPLKKSMKKEARDSIRDFFLELDLKGEMKGDAKRLTSDYSDMIGYHRVWLRPFGESRLDKWEKLLKDNPEAALCEAAARKMLSEYKVEVKPYEDLSSGGPDFLCTKDNGCFYVEVTCISKDAATKKTGLSDELPKPSKVQRFGLPVQTIFNELRNKVSQCSDLDAPCILAIGTLHFQAEAVCFSKPLNKIVAEQLLTGTSQITMKIDPEQGQAIGDPYQTTELRNSAFIRFQKNSDGQVEFARNPVSAILLCGFGCRPPDVVGALHPNANHKFDRSLLPDIEFYRLVEGCQNTGKLKVEWI